MAALNLSDLNTSVAYPLENSQSSGKCLIHMKLTDFCVRSIDGLVNSNKVGNPRDWDMDVNDVDP